MLCVKDELETGTDCNIDPSSPLDHSSIFSHLGLGCSTVGHWGSQSPQSASWFSRWHPVSDCLKPSELLVILFSNVHQLPLFFCLFTQVHLLIDGSVAGQYITLVFFASLFKFHDAIDAFFFLLPSNSFGWSAILWVFLKAQFVLLSGAVQRKLIKMTAYWKQVRSLSHSRYVVTMSFKQTRKMVIITTTINGDMYIEILNRFLMPSIENLFGEYKIIFRTIVNLVT